MSYSDVEVSAATAAMNKSKKARPARLLSW